METFSYPPLEREREREREREGQREVGLMRLGPHKVLGISLPLPCFGPGMWKKSRTCLSLSEKAKPSGFNYEKVCKTLSRPSKSVQELRSSWGATECKTPQAWKNTKIRKNGAHLNWWAASSQKWHFST